MKAKKEQYVMRYFKTLTMALMAVFAVGIAATTSAQASEFRVLPEKSKFTFKSVGTTNLRTLSGKEVKCLSVSGSGEFTSDRLGPVEFKFVDCTGPLSVKCTGLGDTTEGTITVKAEFHIRHLLSTGGVPEEVSLNVLVGTVHFSCFGVLFVVTGNVCSDDVKTLAGGSPIHKLVEDLLVNFLESAANSGDPKVTLVDTDNSLGMETCALSTKEGGATAESSSQKGEGILECQNAAGVKITCLIDLLGSL